MKPAEPAVIPPWNYMMFPSAAQNSRAKPKGSICLLLQVSRYCLLALQSRLLGKYWRLGTSTFSLLNLFPSLLYQTPGSNQGRPAQQDQTVNPDPIKSRKMYFFFSVTCYSTGHQPFYLYWYPRDVDSMLCQCGINACDTGSRRQHQRARVSNDASLWMDLLNMLQNYVMWILPKSRVTTALFGRTVVHRFNLINYSKNDDVCSTIDTSFKVVGLGTLCIYLLPIFFFQSSR